MNEDHVICTLDEGAKLSIEFTVENGKGYVSSVANRKEDAPIGVIPIDSIYSPVIQVSYNVDNARELFGMPNPIDQMESWKDDPFSQKSSSNNHQVTSATESKDSTTYYMVQDTESLLRLLQAVEQASPHSAGTLQLHYYRMETGSVTWLLKNRIGALLSV